MEVRCEIYIAAKIYYSPPSDTDNENDTSEPTKERKRIIKLTDDDSEEEEKEEEEKENREGNLTLNWDETQDLSEANPVAISRSNTDDLSISFTSKKGKVTQQFQKFHKNGMQKLNCIVDHNSLVVH